MSKKKKKRSKTLKEKLNYEISNEFGMNNGPEEVRTDVNKSCKNKNKRNCK